MPRPSHFSIEKTLPVLVNRPKTARKYLGQGDGDLAGPHPLSQQPRRPRRFRDDHGGPTGESLAPGGVTGIHEDDTWVDSDFVSQDVRGQKWKLWLAPSYLLRELGCLRYYWL